MNSPRRAFAPAAIGIFAAALSLSVGTAKGQTLLTYWNFNNVSPAYDSGSGLLGSFSTTAAVYGEAYSQTNKSTPGSLASNSANGTIYSGSISFASVSAITNPTINGKTPTAYTSQNATSGNAGFGAFADSTVNRALTDSTTGGSLLLLNTGGNFRGQYLTFSLSSAGYENLTFSYSTRLTNSVTSSQVWTYSINGTDYFALTTVSPTANATFNTQTLNLSSLSSSSLNNQSVFYLRMTYTSSNAQGSQAIDNIQLLGTAAAIPEPSAFAALGGLATLGFAATRRRRA